MLENIFRKICFLKKGLTRSIDVGILYLVVEKQTHARVAQLVEHDLAKVGVAGSSPVSRSQRKQKRHPFSDVFLFFGCRWNPKVRGLRSAFRSFDSVESDFSLPT